MIGSRDHQDLNIPFRDIEIRCQNLEIQCRDLDDFEIITRDVAILSQNIFRDPISRCDLIILRLFLEQ